jgi:hypothetical protein
VVSTDRRGVLATGSGWRVGPYSASKMSGGATHTAGGPTEVARPGAARVSTLSRLRVWLGSAVAAFLGLLPHILHHAGPLAGAALLGGVAGALLFGVIGFVVAIPFMLRLRRRSGGWRLPAAAMGLFMVVFSISTFVIGPAINGSDSGSSTPAASSQQGQDGSQTPNESESAHESHH